MKSPHQGTTAIDAGPIGQPGSEVVRLRRRIEELEELLGLEEAVDPHFLGTVAAHRSRVEVILKLLAARQLVSEYAIGLAPNEDKPKLRALMKGEAFGP